VILVEMELGEFLHSVLSTISYPTLVLRVRRGVTDWLVAFFEVGSNLVVFRCKVPRSGKYAKVVSSRYVYMTEKGEIKHGDKPPVGIASFLVIAKADVEVVCKCGVIDILPETSS